MIIVICVEGKASNTEVNFFRGLNHHLSLELRVFPFEKFRNSKPREEQIVAKLKNDVVQQLFQTVTENETKLFFIGDGDQEMDLEAMRFTRTTIANYLEANYPKIDIEKPILHVQGLGFEQLYAKILPDKVFPTNSKKASNKSLFNNFATKAGWFHENQAVNLQKMRSDLRKSGNPHTKIVEAIILLQQAQKVEY